MSLYHKLLKEKEAEFESVKELMTQKQKAHNEEMCSLEAQQLRIQGAYNLLLQLIEENEQSIDNKEHS